MTEREYRRAVLIGSLLSLLVMLGALVFVAVARGEEKDKCPTELDPYDPAWVLVIAGHDEEYFSWGRHFVYQPDPVLRVKGEFVESCVGSTTSFLIEEREQLIWKTLYRGEEETHFLQNKDGEWISGTDIWNLKAKRLTAGGKLIIHLYKNDKVVAVRTIPVPMDYDWTKAKAEKEKRREAEKEANEEEK